MKATLSARNVVIIVIICGLVAMVGAMMELQSVFLAEHQHDLRTLQDNKRKIEAYARQAFASTLIKRLDAAIVDMNAALEDPLLARSHYWWRQGSRQYFPLAWNFLQPSEQTAEELYQQINNSARQSNLNTQWSNDRQLLWKIHKAVISKDPQAFDFQVKELLRYLTRNRLQTHYEMAFRINMLEIFGEYSKASPILIKKLLRDGVNDGSGNAIQGLQRDIIWRRNKLSLEDFVFLRRKILKLSEQNTVSYEDFEQVTALQPELQSALALHQWPPRLDNSGPFIWQNSWYIQHRDNADVGVAIELNELLKEIADTMLKLGLLSESETVRLKTGNSTGQEDSARQEINALSFSWESDKWNRNKQELEQFYQIKQRVLLASAIITVGIIILTWLVYQRQQRWVGIKSEFVATVCHEIRTPLSAIRLMAERLMVLVTGDDKAKDYSRRIIADIDTLSFLVENILSYERLNRGQWITHTSPISLRELFDELGKELVLYSKKPFTIDIESSGDKVIYGDPVLIKLLFMNLAKNSCSYNDHEYVKLCIKWRADGNLLIDYVDNGTGFSENEKKECFEPFYRGLSQRHTRGSGLGLALCRKVAGLHGGSVTIASSGSNGSHFVIELKDKNSHD